MTTTVIRPNAVASSYGVSNVGGAANLAAATSDSNDATYAQFNLVGAYTVFSLGTFALAAGDMVKSIQPAVRAVNHTGVPNASRFSAGWQYLGGGYGTSQPFVPGLAMATLTGSPVTAAAFAGLSQAAQQVLLDGLEFVVQVTPGSSEFRIAEAFLNVVVAAAPTTTVTAPTGTITDRSIVTGTFSHAPGSDGGPQTWWEAKVFSDAQYLAGGFDPATSTPVWTSGVQVGSATTVTPPSLDDDVYRLYVRTAQSTNGAQHWATWAYSGFTIAVDRPDVDTVVAGVDAAHGLVEITVEQDTSGVVLWDTVDVEASYDGGGTWRAVAGATNVDAPTDTVEVIDVEVPIGTAARYRARGRAVVSGNEVVGAWVESNDVTWTPASAWLKSLADAGLGMAICFRDFPTERRARPRGVHRVHGRAKPVVRRDVLSSREGVLVVWADDEAERDALDMLLESEAGPWLLQQPASMGQTINWYVELGDVEHFRPSGGERTAMPQRGIPVTYVEVDRPLVSIAPVAP